MHSNHMVCPFSFADSQDGYCFFPSKVPMLLEISLMKKGLMLFDMLALVPERVVACTLPIRWVPHLKYASSSEPYRDRYMI
jgi:hypothetical protein